LEFRVGAGPSPSAVDEEAKLRLKSLDFDPLVVQIVLADVQSSNVTEERSKC
jgi:hypothetical protein